MKMLGHLLLALLVLTGPALADSPLKCDVAKYLIDINFPLQQVSKAVADKRLNILVVGAGSSTLPGSNGAKSAFPARLEVALAERLPGVAVKVTADVKSRRTAPEMLKVLRPDLVSVKPALVIWQTGTADAMRAIEIETFSEALDAGIAHSKAAGADIVLVNAQYSPRTESMIALGAYAESMRWISLQREIPIFDRFSIMKVWAELGIFDFYAATKKLDMAQQVHDCIGRLLADLVIEAAKPVTPATAVGR